MNLLGRPATNNPPRPASRSASIARRQLRLPMPIVKILLVLLALASPLSMAGSAVAGPFEDAQAAHGRRDYATALGSAPLADQGNAAAHTIRVHVRPRPRCAEKLR